MPKVYIAIYRPREGNYYHWALYLRSKPPVILEVTGSYPHFQRNVVHSKPESSRRHIENIKVGEISDDEVDQFFSIMEDATIDNDTTEWNCQDYVLEALEELADECLLDEDDEDYQQGIRRAKRKYFGAQ